jgi:ribonuclease BN (tRNA processing enzyme)
MTRTPLLLLATLALAACAPLAPVAPMPASAGTRIYTLGTQGGPLPAGERAQPANAVVVRGRIYLVDAGNGVVGQLRKAGLDYRRVDRIFVTHNHDDHNADWGTLMGLQWSTGRRSEIHVHGPAGTEDMLKGYLQYLEPNARIRSSDSQIPQQPKDLFRAHDIRDGGLVYQDEWVTVTALENCHYHFNPATPALAARDTSYAYRFQTPDKVIVFSGDTGRCAKLEAFARDADVLVHEVVSLPLIADSLRTFMASQPGASPSGLFEGLMRHMADDHTVPEDIGRLATAARVKKVVLTHFVPGRDSDPDSAYVDGVKQHYSGPVVAARDLMAH